MRNMKALLFRWAVAVLYIFVFLTTCAAASGKADWIPQDAAQREQLADELRECSAYWACAYIFAQKNDLPKSKTLHDLSYAYQAVSILLSSKERSDAVGEKALERIVVETDSCRDMNKVSEVFELCPKHIDNVIHYITNRYEN